MVCHARSLRKAHGAPAFAPRNASASRSWRGPERRSTIRAIRTKEFSYIENYAHRPLLDLPWDIEESPSGHAVAPLVTAPRPERELYDLRADPTETNNLLAGDGLDGSDLIAADLAVRLHDWRQQTGDVIPSDFAGSRIAARYTETYLQIHETAPTSRSAIAVDRGIEDEVSQIEH